MSDLKERILDNIQCEPNTGCHFWMGSVNDKGYGYIRVSGRLLRVHRVAYEAFVGPIPDGLQIDHLCRQRSCVNPEHLEAVTRSENVLRGLSGYAIRNKCKSGKHEITETSFYTSPCGNRQCRQCRRNNKLRWKERHNG